MDKAIKILLAERNPHVRDFERREFEAEGYQVQTAGDGKAIWVALAQTDPPDILILDLDLPPMDGLELLEQLQNRTPALPIIIHSNLLRFEDHPAVRSTEAFVEKDGDLNGLKQAVADVVRRHVALERAGR